MVSGDLQSEHFPVILQGVFISNLWVFATDATFLARFIALSISEHILFIPTIKTTFLGPCAIHETRFAFPSIFTSTPSSVIAFALERNISASYAASNASLGSIFALSI